MTTPRSAPRPTPSPDSGSLRPTNESGGAASELKARRPVAPLQRPSTPSHVWFAFDRWLPVITPESDDDFVLA